MARRLGGPVFLPRKKPSKLAETLLAGQPPEGDRLTAYDDLWYRGRPSEP